MKGKGSALRSWITARGPRLTRLAVVVLPVASAAVGVALVLLVAGTLFGGSEPAARPRPAAIAAKPTATPIPSDAPVDRVIVSKIGVDAPVEVLSVSADGAMPDSSGPEVVSLYDFSPYSTDFGGRPGFGGSALIGGHVDYINYGPAVFWGLGELKEGDQVEVRLSDGTVYRYAVTWNKTFPWSDMPWDYVLKPENGNESVTLMTCAGAWTGKRYTEARVVRAERIPDGASLMTGGP